MDNKLYICISIAAFCWIIGNLLAKKAKKTEKKWQLIVSAIFACLSILAIGVGIFFAIKK